MINWIKNNKLTTLLILVVLFFLINSYIRTQELGYSNLKIADYNTSNESGVGMVSYPSAGRMMAAPPSDSYIEPVSDSSNRVVIQNTNLSFLVSDVKEVGSKIVSYAENAGGFMVESSYNRPEESAFATIVVRVPTSRLSEILDVYRSYAVKVTNENLMGRDVTEQYTDIEARLDTLETTKSKFEQILAQATEVQDILQVNQQIIYLQDQIDNLIGQREAIENNASLTKVTVYLSTDELSLPYTPDQKFRPNVVFKLAVRSLFSSLVGFAEIAIWITVYSIIWVPILIIFIAARKYFINKNKSI